MSDSRYFLRPALAGAVLALSLAAMWLPATTASAQRKPAAKAPVLSPAMAPITRAVFGAIRGDRAFRTVDYVQRYFRLPGNRGFDLAIDTVASLLRAAGYVEETSAPPSARLVYRIESRSMRDMAWTPEGASITIVGRPASLQSWPTNLNMIAINSASTAPEGVTAAVVDVGAGVECVEHDHLSMRDVSIREHSRQSAVKQFRGRLRTSSLTTDSHQRPRINPKKRS